jgi:ATP:ADP antiporter, AAA family
MSEAVALTPLERFLCLFARVERREGITALILIANIFLILLAYYLIKPVREGWLAVSVFQGFTQLEVKAYSAFAQTLVLLLVLPVYAALAERWNRTQLISRVGCFFGLMLVVFWICQRATIPYAGVVFYIFVGIFSVTLVAQFWSFASDIYGVERGKRLFPLVAIGASAGAVGGSWIGEQLLATGINAYNLILVSLLPLAAAILFAVWTDRRETGTGTAEPSRRFEPAAPNGESPFRLIVQHRYLTATATMTVLFSWVVASGDNILFGFVQETLQQQIAGSDPAQHSKMINTATTAFYGNLYFWINLVGLLLQAFVVSRVLQYGGFGSLLLITPLVSLAAYASMLMTPVLAVVKVMKIAENSSNYSINNTARHVLWLPATKEMLYQAKPTVDTLCVRIGDGCAALVVLIGTRFWSYSIVDFIAFNLGLIVLWLCVSSFLVFEHRRFSAQQA